jgi:hypothetical protein
MKVGNLEFGLDPYLITYLSAHDLLPPADSSAMAWAAGFQALSPDGQGLVKARATSRLCVSPHGQLFSSMLLIVIVVP